MTSNLWLMDNSAHWVLFRKGAASLSCTRGEQLDDDDDDDDKED